MLILDDIGFVKKGTVGRTENCRISVFAAFTAACGHTRIDHELYLPKYRTDDRERCQAARIPDEQTCAAKGNPARDMILRVLGFRLPPIPSRGLPQTPPTDRTRTSGPSPKSAASPTWP